LDNFPIFVSKYIYYVSIYDIQDFNSEACGYYCLAFIKFLYDKNDKELAFKEFLKMFGKKTIENDNILKKYLDID